MSAAAFRRFHLCCVPLSGVFAQGEAEAAKLIATAVANNPGFVQLREIQYAKDVANTIASSNFKVWMRRSAWREQRLCYAYI